MSQAEELQTLSRFSAELPTQTQLILKQKRWVDEMLKQPSLTSIPKNIQNLLLSLVFTSFVKDKSEDFLTKYKTQLISLISNSAKLMATSLAPPVSDDQFIEILEQQLPSLNQQLGEVKNEY